MISAWCIVGIYLNNGEKDGMWAVHGDTYVQRWFIRCTCYRFVSNSNCFEVSMKWILFWRIQTSLCILIVTVQVYDSNFSEAWFISIHQFSFAPLFSFFPFFVGICFPCCFSKFDSLAYYCYTNFSLFYKLGMVFIDKGRELKVSSAIQNHIILSELTEI